MPAMSSRKRWMRARSGFTLAELLVAMVILLVGIYAVAKGFPSLFVNIDAERQRSEMARLCQATIERLKDHPSRLPEAVAGHLPANDPAAPGLIPPDLEPDETATVAPGNSRDDLFEVMGEVFRVPGVDPSATAAVYPFNLGPADGDPALAPLARELVALERLTKEDFEDLPGGVIPVGSPWFYLDSAGQLFLPADLDAALVDYCWVDADSGVHYAQGEYVAAGGSVRAAGIVDEGPGLPAFDGVVQESCKATGTTEYIIALGDQGHPALTGPAEPDPPVCVLERTYGATLLFHPTAAGKVVQVDYWLRTEPDGNSDPRRALMVMEEVPAPTTEPYQVDLKFAGIDDETPLYETDLEGNDITDVYLLVVDLQNGTCYTDADSEVSLDMINGKVTFTWPDPPGPAAMRGHELRIYYRTLDGHFVQVQKAPRYFIEERLAGQYTGAEATGVDYRTYSTLADSGDAAYTVLTFPESVAGQAVAVDYLYGASAPYQRATGELHVVGFDEGLAAWTIVLTQPDVQAIVGVQGVSLKVRGWWHTQGGRVETLDLDTFLRPRKLS